jgi:hypothetical protein
MTVSLYELSVGSFVRTLDAIVGFLDRGSTYCAENGIDQEEILEMRLVSDMRPFRYQLQSLAHHSSGAIEGVKRGSFSPPPVIPPLSYNELRTLVVDAHDGLQKFSPSEIDVLVGRDMVFRRGEFTQQFTVEGFLLSFSIPNFFFHTTTAYNILRIKGVPLGKNDYLGKLRLKD